MNLNKNSQKGFTLIELLVVISIIALLSTFILGSLNRARSEARDVKRYQELAAVEKALQLYANQNNGNYPHSDIQDISQVLTNDGVIDCASNSANVTNTMQLFDILINGKYLSTYPSQELDNNLGYCYVYMTSSVIVAGALYDEHGVKLANVSPTNKTNDIALFTALENLKTDQGNTAIVGITRGNSPITLNFNLTTGEKSGISIIVPNNNNNNNSCSAGYTWNGYECIIECPSNQTNNNGVCEDRCTSPYVWDGYSCIQTCPSGQTWDGISCVDLCTPPSVWNGYGCQYMCSEGQTWNGSSCENICASYQIYQNGNCTDLCAPNQYWNGSECYCSYGADENGNCI